MSDTRYLLARRFKVQKNRKQKNITEADFRYGWSHPISHQMFEEPCDNINDCFDSLDKVHKELTEHKDQYKYGYKIYKLEHIEESTTDLPHQL